MAKPICLVSVAFSGRDVRENRNEFQEYLDRKFNDYHVIVIPVSPNQQKPIEIEVFYDKDFTIVQFEELRKIIEDKLKALNYEPTKSF